MPSLQHADRGPAVVFDGYEASQAELAALKAHPAFDKAWRQAARHAVDQYRGARLLNGLINDRGRDSVALLALYLHHTASPRDAQSGLTVSRLKSICADQDIASPGRIEALLMLMRASGLLQPVPGAGDKRVRRLAPTERLSAIMRERWGGLLAAMTPIFPEAADARAALADKAFTRALVTRFGVAFLAGFRLIDDLESMGLFTDRNAGLMIAFSLAMAGDPARTTPVPVSISSLARQFHVSRIHVRTMLRDAAAAGYIDWPDARATTVVVRSPLHEVVQNFFANAFLAMRYFAIDAFDELAAARDAHLTQHA